MDPTRARSEIDRHCPYYVERMHTTTGAFPFRLNSGTFWLPEITA